MKFMKAGEDVSNEKLKLQANMMIDQIKSASKQHDDYQDSEEEEKQKKQSIFGGSSKFSAGAKMKFDNGPQMPDAETIAQAAKEMFLK